MSTTLMLTILFTSVSQTFHLPEGALSALCFVESHHTPSAVHKDDGKGNSLGVCQIKYPTAKLMGYTGKESDLMLPTNNAYYAGKYLQHQMSRYNGDMGKAFAAYNAGSYRVKKDGTTLNKAYVIKVKRAWANNR